jgi:hypothetical protein
MILAIQGQSNMGVRRRPLMAGLLLGLFLSVLAVAQFRALHHALHPEAGQPGHQCAATLLSSGQVDSAAADLSVSIAPVAVRVGAAPEIAPLPAPDFFLLPGRGPPASLT